MNRELTELNPNDITVRTRIREDSGDMDSLESSIRKLGLLCPLIVDRDNVLISGDRRLQVCRKLGIQTVPVIRLDTDYNSMAALDVKADDNLCREPLNPEELEKQIRLKKRLMGEGTERTGGFIGRLKGLFGHKASPSQAAS